MLSPPVFEMTRVVVSKSFLDKMPSSLSKAQFFREFCKDLECAVTQEEECVSFSLEGFWENIVKAEDILVSSLKKWNSLNTFNANDSKKVGLSDGYNKDPEQIKIRLSHTCEGDFFEDERARMVEEIAEDMNIKFNTNNLQVECSRYAEVPCKNVDCLKDGNVANLPGVSEETETLIEDDKLLSSVPSFIATQEVAMSADGMNAPVSVEVTDIPAENEIYMDIQLEHNYNNLSAGDVTRTPSENGEPSVENEIYMDIKLSKQDDQIFAHPDLPVTLVVAKEDEPGVEVLQLNVNKASGLISSVKRGGVGRFSSQNQERLRLHRKKYEEQAPFRYFCSQCSFKTKRHSHMRNHSKLHEKVCTIYSCDQCDFSTIRASHLQRHLGTHKTEVFACSECTYSTHTEALLTKHQRYKHIVKNSVESKTKDTYQCLHCDYMTTSEKFFHRHMSVHEKKGRVKQSCFKCNQCSYQTPSRSNYYRHIGGVHGDKRPYMCTTCGLCFKRSDTLVQHQATHVNESGAGAFLCSKCQKSYRSASALKEHSLTHEDERRYLCEICAASFKTRAVQKKHFNHKHGHMKINPCSSCSKSFSSKYLLKRHMKVHGQPQYSETSVIQSESNSEPMHAASNPQQWSETLLPAQPSTEDVQVIVIHQESTPSELSVQEGPLFQVGSSLIPGQTLSVPVIPVEYVISAADSASDGDGSTSMAQISSRDGDLISLTLVHRDSTCDHKNSPSS